MEVHMKKPMPAGIMGSVKGERGSLMEKTTRRTALQTGDLVTVVGSDAAKFDSKTHRSPTTENLPAR
jgi:hypothetical protein